MLLPKVLIADAISQRGLNELSRDDELDVAIKIGEKAADFNEKEFRKRVDDVVAQLQAFYKHYANNPALVRYQGRPVIFFWQAGRYDNGTWDAIRAQVDPDHNAVWIADGDQFGILSGDAWDGISPYAIAWSCRSHSPP